MSQKQRGLECKNEGQLVKLRVTKCQSIQSFNTDKLKTIKIEKKLS